MSDNTNATIVERILREMWGDEWDRGFLCVLREGGGFIARRVHEIVAREGLAAWSNQIENLFVPVAMHRAWDETLDGRDERGRPLDRRVRDRIVKTACWVVDDVGLVPNASKVAPAVVEGLLGPPSWSVETSPGNFQWFYLMSRHHDADQHAEGMSLIREGLGLGKLDGPSANHVFRLPAGANVKPDRVLPDGSYWRPRLAARNKGVALSVANLKALVHPDPFAGTEFEGKVATTAPKWKPRPDSSKTAERPCASLADPDAVLQLLSEFGMVKHDKGDGQIEITCPNVDEHTGGLDDGTVYRGRGRIYCQHEHCIPVRLPNGEPDAGEMAKFLLGRLKARVYADSGGLVGRPGTPMMAMGLGAKMFPDDVPTDEVQRVSEQMNGGKAAWERVFREWAYVLEVERFVRLDKPQKFYSATQFGARMVALTGTKFGRSGEKSAAAIFINDGRATVLDDLDYLPGREPIIDRADGTRVLNQWTPPVVPAWSTQATDGDVAPWLDVIRHWAPDSERQEFVLDWMAHMLQHPRVKINWLLLVHSDVEGVGKDTFFTPLWRILGPDNVAQIGTADIMSPYNARWVPKHGVAIQELHAGVSRADGMVTLDKLKQHITSPPERVRVQQKHVEAWEVTNVMCPVAFTNRRDALPVDTADRRIVVIESKASVRLPSAVAKAFWTWLGDPANEALPKIRSWLEHRKIGAAGSLFEARECPVMTSGTSGMARDKAEMARGSLSAGAAWIVDEFLNSGRKLFSKREITLRVVSGRADTVSRRVKELTDRDFTEAARFLGAVPVHDRAQIRMSGPLGRSVVWALDATKKGLYDQMTAKQIADAYTKELTDAGHGWLVGAGSTAAAGGVKNNSGDPF